MLALLMKGLYPQNIAGFVRVAVERGIDRYPDGLTYAIDDELADLRVGEQVVVPLGRGNTPTPGYIVERLDDVDDPDALKHVLKRSTAARSLPVDLIELACWMSSYYMAPLGLTIASMLPSAVRKGTGATTLRLIDLNSVDPPDAPRLSPKQRRVLEVLKSLPATDRPIERKTLAGQADLKTCGPIDRLVQQGQLVETRATTIEAVWRHAMPTQADCPTPTPTQQKIIDDIGGLMSEGFSTHLLLGVTGSGKTEVYIRLIEQALSLGRLVLVLVPEISLTPQTGGRLTSRFPGKRIALLHSGLTQAQRHHEWARVADDEVDIILGARSAVLAPLRRARLGLIIVDEEHDPSYKQDATPRYHGRDVAIRLGQMAQCPVVLGSATPSIESWANATTRGRATLHRMPQRAPGLSLPHVRLVDMAAERRGLSTSGSPLIGPTLELALERLLAGSGQALLLLNRRGLASYLACRNRRCGWMLSCDNCDVTMVMHRNRELPRGGFVRCHHCLAERRVPATCESCGGGLAPLGQGTQRVEEVLRARFPQLVPGDTLQRIDSDTMRKADDFHVVLGAFGRGEVRVLLGTQMIAKGLDYPGVQLVGVIDADTAIHLPDFRASERTYQLVAQVCGRCGRGESPGTAIVQTYNPETPAIRLAAEGRYEAFAASELEDRIACGLPPARRMARLVIQDSDHDRCLSLAATLKDRLSQMAGEGVEIRGPVACVIARIASRFRRQIELLADTPADLHHLLAKARHQGLFAAGERVTIDVDPMSLM